MNAAFIYDQWAQHLIRCEVCTEMGPNPRCLNGPTIFRMAQDAVREIARQLQPDPPPVGR